MRRRRSGPRGRRLAGRGPASARRPLRVGSERIEKSPGPGRGALGTAASSRESMGRSGRASTRCDLSGPGRSIHDDNATGPPTGSMARSVSEGEVGRESAEVVRSVIARAQARVVPMAETSDNHAKQTRGPVVLPVRQRRRDEEQLRLRHPDVPGGAASSIPANSLYRQALRGVERRKFDNEPSKVGRLVGMKTQPMPAGPEGDQGAGASGSTCSTSARTSSSTTRGTSARAEYAAEAAEQLGLHSSPSGSWSRSTPRPGRRGLLPPPGPRLRAEREVGEGDQLLGEGQADRPERRGGQAQDQRASRPAPRSPGRASSAAIDATARARRPRQRPRRPRPRPRS